ncbi:hypothetical protein [Amycolatopsis pigmentata]|uniref:Uncharacterized protein n=1 Tax=Amycolatopsis pigmentata TaxID=450801 RepID=A0ABW5FUU5_9PSEU
MADRSTQAPLVIAHGTAGLRTGVTDGFGFGVVAGGFEEVAGGWDDVSGGGVLVVGGGVLLDSVVLGGTGSGAVAAVFVVPGEHAATNAVTASPPSDAKILFTRFSPEIRCGPATTETCRICARISPGDHVFVSCGFE